MLKNYPHWRESPQGSNKLEEVVIVEDMERETPRIYALLDTHQADHKSPVLV